MIEHKKNSVLDALIGCRIQTHYGTGGIVTSYSGPYDDDELPWGKGRYTIQYRRENEKKPSCWINSIKVENDVVTCEGVLLQILGREEESQMSLF